MMNSIEKALKTWYPKDHPLHLDLLHPAIGLAGEAGELLDLYKKEAYKDGVSWWDCAYCNSSQPNHYENRCLAIFEPTQYTPKTLDELGDLWFYFSILA